MRAWMLYVLLLFFVWLPSVSLHAQAQVIADSLISELPNHKDSSKVFLLIDITIEMTYVDVEKAKVYSEQAYELAKEIRLPEGMGRALEMLGYCYHLLDDYEKAETLYLEALEILVKNGNCKFESSVSGKLAQIYALRGDYPKSNEYYTRALDASRSIGGDMYIGTIIFGLAENYTKLGAYKKAFALLEESLPLITYEPHLIYYYAILGDLHCATGATEEGLVAFEKAAKLCEDFDDQMRLAYIYEMIAKAYFDLGVYEKTADYYLQIIEISKALELPTLDIMSRKGLGTIYKIWDEPNQSIAYYEEALELSLEAHLTDHIIELRLLLGEVFLNLKQYSKAEAHLQSALFLAKEIKSPASVIKAYLQLCNSYVESRKYEAALNLLSELELFLAEEDENKWSHFYLSIISKKGEIYFRQKEYAKSVITLRGGLKKNIAFDNKKEQSNYYNTLSRACEKIGNNNDALYFYQQHVILEDSIRQIANNKAVNAIRILYETREKEKEIEKLQQEKAMQSLALDHQKSELSRKQSYLLFLLFLLLSLGLGSYLIFNRFKWQKKNEKLQLVNSKIALEKQHLKTRQQLEIAKLRAHLFTNISHEFRTPLTLILSPLESVLSGDTKLQSPMLKMMHNNAKKLLELVNETLDLAKLESGTITLKRELCNINLLIRDIFRNFLPIAQKNNILLKIKNESQYQLIDVDQQKMERAISNLLSNALRYSPSGSEVLITLQNDEKGFQINIRDEGAGIPAEHQPYIFDRYYQVDKYSFQGTGIGLALTKEIIELHGGAISVESQIGEGTVFTISLPFEKMQTKKEVIPSSQTEIVVDVSYSMATNTLYAGRAVDTASKANSIKHTHCILIVEDNRDVMDYLANTLSTIAQVERARNGKEALTITRHLIPDLIICDIMMPIMDGMEFTRHLKKDIQISHIPIILLTAKASLESKLDGLEIGADDYLTKPFNARELLLRSQNLIIQREKLKQFFKADKTIIPENLTVNKLDQEFLKKALMVVNDNLDNPDFNVERFTALIGMSRTNLYTKLKALTGKNILEFIRTLRIKEAVQLIKTNSGNMNDIAYQTGFNNRQSFIKSFKLEMGKTPSQYKKTLSANMKSQS